LILKVTGVYRPANIDRNNCVVGVVEVGYDSVMADQGYDSVMADQ